MGERKPGEDAGMDANGFNKEVVKMRELCSVSTYRLENVNLLIREIFIL